ncbi:LLM class flavin-dependent oxidoreductase, partial [Streptomyces sp. NPDC002082]|uniref:LLM class flavin-dependent oxidoreductase n=1 Tax=Streptomyces sp. NPDC002082 TaxID=3154772 RepID=UPI00331C02F7
MTEHPVGPEGRTPAITLGLNTFGDVHTDSSGTRLSDAQTIRNLVDEGVLAEATGVDYFGIGEHHTESFPLSAGDVVLAAIAARTSRIRLGSAVTVISSDDPVRVFQRYSTLDSLSNGRAEVIVGRGSSIESFPLFGYDLRNYDELFEEKVNLFAELLKEKPVTWRGNTRAALSGQTVYPRTESGHLSTWIGVGGSPESVVRAARYGFALMIAIIGGETARFAPFAGLFHLALAEFGQPDRPVGVHSPGHVAATDDQAIEEFWPHYETAFAEAARVRGFRPPT